MVYLNVLQSSNAFPATKRQRQPVSLPKRVWKAAHFLAAFSVVLVIAGALVAHGLWSSLSTAASNRAIRRQVRDRYKNARYVPGYPSAMA